MANLIVFLVLTLGSLAAVHSKVRCNQASMPAVQQDAVRIGDGDDGTTCLIQTSRMARKDESQQAEQPPQKLSIGSVNQSAQPWISSDVWLELIDHKHVVMLRQDEPGFPTPAALVKWLDSRPHKVSILINNQVDLSFPEIGKIESWRPVLEHHNVKFIFAGNPSMVAPNVVPIPLGPKWNMRFTQLFSENKSQHRSLYANVSQDGESSARLFHASREPVVWIRPMSGFGVPKYARDNSALRATRGQISSILKKSLNPEDLSISSDRRDRLPPSDYFRKLKTVAFVVSPAGNGLDCHATWEALMAGCIPIVPHSPLRSMFDDLPVWLVKDWSEVTSKSMKLKAKELRQRKYNFGKLFSPFWKAMFRDLSSK